MVMELLREVLMFLRGIGISLWDWVLAFTGHHWLPFQTRLAVLATTLCQ